MARPASGPKIVAAGLVAVWSVWVVSLPAFSVEATVAVLASGCAAMLGGVWLRRRQAGQATGPTATVGMTGRSAGLAAWLALIAFAGCWQLASYLQEPRSEHPTLSSMMNAVLDSLPARTVAFALWLLIAVELVRR